MVAFLVWDQAVAGSSPVTSTIHAYTTRRPSATLMAEHNDLGRWGEDLAEALLTAKGYTIVERNCRIARHEVDIIAVDGDTYVFVEVKTRNYNHLVAPRYAVDTDKMRSLRLAASAFAKKYRLHHPIRFDIISVVGSPESNLEPNIEHTENAFDPLLL